MKTYENFLIYRGPHYAVYFHAENSKESAVYEYYKKCDVATRANLLYLIERISEYGQIYDTTKFRIENKTNTIYAFKAKKQDSFVFLKKEN